MASVFRNPESRYISLSAAMFQSETIVPKFIIISIMVNYLSRTGGDGLAIPRPSSFMIPCLGTTQ